LKKRKRKKIIFARVVCGNGREKGVVEVV